MIVSINIDNQLVLQNLPSRIYGEQLCAVLSKFETATVQNEDKNCPSTVCIAFENEIWASWSSNQNQMMGRRVMMETIKFIESMSYRLVVNFKVKAHSDCIFFERKSEQLTSPPTDLLMMSFLGDGKIAVIGDPFKSEHVGATFEHLPSLSSLIDQVVSDSVV